MEDIQICFTEHKTVIFRQHVIFQLTASAGQSLSVFRKSRRRDQSPLWLYCMTERKDHFCCSVTAYYLFRFYPFRFCDPFPENAASHLRILCNMIQTVDNGLLHTFRCSQRIQICRKIQAVFMFIYVSSMYVFCHWSFSCLYLLLP